MEMRTKGTYGIHCSFYHYGFEHLVINLYNYCSKKIAQGDIIYFSVDPQIFEEIVDVFKENGNLDLGKIKNRPIFEIIPPETEQNQLKKIEEKLNRIINREVAKGHEGISWINQVEYAVQKISEEKINQVEKYFNDLLSDKKASMLCFYDYETYLNTGKNKDLIFNSHKTHDYLLYKMEVSKKKINIS